MDGIQGGMMLYLRMRFSVYRGAVTVTEAAETTEKPSLCHHHELKQPGKGPDWERRKRAVKVETWQVATRRLTHTPRKRGG